MSGTETPSTFTCSVLIPERSIAVEPSLVAIVRLAPGLTGSVAAPLSVTVGAVRSTLTVNVDVDDTWSTASRARTPSVFDPSGRPDTAAPTLPAQFAAQAPVSGVQARVLVASTVDPCIRSKYLTPSPESAPVPDAVRVPVRNQPVGDAPAPVRVGESGSLSSIDQSDRPCVTCTRGFACSPSTSSRVTARSPE